MSTASLNRFGFVHRFEPGTSGRSLLLLHGTGGNESDLIDLGRQLAPDAALLSPRGKVLEKGMPRFFRRLREGVFDLVDLEHRANELADFVLQASEAYGLDRNTMCAVGFSNGANITGAMLLLRPEVIRQAVLLRAMVPLIPATAPDLKQHRVLIEAGSADPLVSPEQLRELVDLFRGYGAKTTLFTANAGHHLTNADVVKAQQWIGAAT
jgi:phospholipase/carboxylesterase